MRRICFAAGRSAEVGQAPDPVPGPGQLLVRVEAVGAGLGLVLGATRVVAAVGSADKADFVRQCGADEVVTYAQPSWGDPVDVVLDGVGADAVRRGVETLAPFGRLVAFSAGGGSVEVGSLLAARANLGRVVLRTS